MPISSASRSPISLIHREDLYGLMDREVVNQLYQWALAYSAVLRIRIS